MKAKLLLGITTLSLLVAGVTIYFLNGSSVENTTAYAPRAEKEAAKGWYGAAEEYMKMKMDVNTGEIDPKHVIKAYNEVLAFRNKPKRSGALNLTWKEMGPNNIGGRTRAVLVYKKGSTKKLFAGGVSGGLFVSNDNAGSWNSVKGFPSNCIIASIAQAPNGDIWVGTGTSFDATAGGGILFNGMGIFISTDGGSNFTQLSSTLPTWNTSGETWHAVNRIAFHPTNKNVYAATHRGLLMLDDYSDTSGTWINPVWLDFPTSGTCNIPNPGIGHDVEVAANGRVYAAIGGTYWYSVTGDDCSFLRSTPVLTEGRMDITVAPSNNNIVWLLGTDGTSCNVYKSTDKGLTFTKLLSRITNSGAEDFDPFCCNSQGRYDMFIQVYPNNSGKVMIGGVQLWTYDGNLTRVAHEQGSPFGFDPYYVHADKHYATFDPDNPDILYVATDGGVATSFDGGLTYVAVNNGYNVTQFYGMAYGPDGMVMGGTQDNGTLFIPGSGGLTGLEAFEIRGGDGFDCDVSQITGTTFSSIYFGALARAKDFSGSWADMCNPYCSTTGAFWTRTRLWETLNDPTSQDSIVFTIDTTEQGVGIGTGNKKKFTGTLTPVQSAGNLMPGTVSFRAGQKQMDDFDGDGVLTGDGNGSINYGSGAFTVTFDQAPNQNLIVYGYFSTYYNANDILELKSNTGEITINHTLATNLNPGDVLTIQDPVQSLLAFNGGDGVVVTREALNFEVANPAWFNVGAAGPQSFTGSPTCFEFSTDGNHLFVGNQSGSVYRISGLSKLYSAGDVATQVTCNRIFTSAQYVTGLAVDQTDPDNVLVTLGNYNNSNYVYLSTNATTSSASFTSVQGDLPTMPVYDSDFHILDNKVVVLGTEYGVYATEDIFAGSVVWLDQNANFPLCPVYDVRQQKRPWKYGDKVIGNHEVFYLGTHGRGIWRTESLVSVTDPGAGSNLEASLISDMTVYPNPSSGETYLSFELSQSATGEIRIFDLSGKTVKVVNNSNLKSGKNTLRLNTNDLTAGTYFVTVQAEGVRKVSKFVVIK